ncbi:MAG: flagellar biosynthesis regulator FlaF [Proteobacteria bacterium]|nr:flagellar biosynthesis regulator FlaF [Pseudomonadota bacterium]
MQNAHEAYSKTAKLASKPRQLEASLLLKAASQLQDIHDSWPGDRDALHAVLTYNQRLWTVFVGAVAEDDSPLPQEIRDNVASLGVFIFKHTLEIQQDPAPEKLLALININKEIATGLRANTSAH